MSSKNSNNSKKKTKNSTLKHSQEAGKGSGSDSDPPPPLVSDSSEDGSDDSGEKPPAAGLKQKQQKSSAPPPPPPMTAEDHKLKGDEHFKLAQFKEAVASYTSALGLNPGSAVLYSNRSAAYKTLKRYKEALTDAERCIDIEPSFAKGHYRKGSALLGMDKVQEAVDAFMTSLRLNPNDKDCKRNYGEALERLKKKQVPAKSVLDSEDDEPPALADESESDDDDVSNTASSKNQPKKKNKKKKKKKKPAARKASVIDNNFDDDDDEVKDDFTQPSEPTQKSYQSGPSTASVNRSDHANSKNSRAIAAENAMKMKIQAENARRVKSADRLKAWFRKVKAENGAWIKVKYETGLLSMLRSATSSSSSSRSDYPTGRNAVISGSMYGQSGPSPASVNRPDYAIINKYAEISGAATTGQSGQSTASVSSWRIKSAERVLTWSRKQRRKQMSWAALKEELKITHAKEDLEDDSKALDFEENDVVSKMESEGIGSTAETIPDNAVDSAFEENETGAESAAETLEPTNVLEKMETLTLAPSIVVNVNQVSDEGGYDEEHDDLEGLIDLEPEAVVQSILLSVHVRTWIKKFSNNRALMNVFRIRMRDLAAGKRNYCNYKELKSHRSNNRIYESKLSKGDRILFTRWANVDEDTMEVRECLLIWYVSSHDKVPANMEKIYSSYDRKVVNEDNWALLQASSSSSSSSSSSFGGERINLLLVDPDCNNMMRTFHVPATHDDIEKIGETNWNPPLQLTEKEIEIVNTRSSILLLGRGGTGKTYCLVSRIHRDQTRLSNIRAIFVSYTERLKNNVAFIYKNMCEAQGETEESKLNVLFKTTIRSLTDYIYRDLNTKGFASLSAGIDFTNMRNRVVYSRFRDEFFKSLDKAHQKLPALRVWTQIYSFIKGSIEAAKAGTPLTREQYVNETTMSKNRCRLNMEDRGLAYAVFEKYQLWAAREALWDQMDLVIEVFGMLSRYNKVENLPFYDRVYVDEVQDLTQSEIGILFMMSSRDSNAYFFAGDTAQSITDGVDFRFDEVRSCFYSLMNYNIFEHPKRLNTNFRSHDGIIQAANSVLQLLYKTFPKSVDEMDTQTGLARGPKPGIIAKASVYTILRLVDADPKLRLLTWDENVDSLRSALDAARLTLHGDSDADLTPLSVFGIKNIKGLEFENVALVDFFSTHKSVDLQKNWKFLVQRTGREPEGFPLPDLEMHLKILYTAVTRARSKLLFVEREESVAFSSWSRNLITNQLAERVPDQDDTDSRSNTMTTKPTKTIMLPDDYRIEGILLAEYASEPDKEAAEAASLLVDSLRNLVHVINAESSTDFDRHLVFKAKSQLKVLKLELLLARRWSERRAGDLGSVKGVDGIPTDLLVSDGGTKNSHMQLICGELNEFLVKQSKLSIEVVAAEAVSICLEAGMLDKAAELARSYCERPHLRNLHDKIRELVEFGVE